MRVVAENYEMTHTHTHTHARTHTHNARDNYSNPRCTHVHRGLNNHNISSIQNYIIDNIAIYIPAIRTRSPQLQFHMGVLKSRENRDVVPIFYRPKKFTTLCRHTVVALLTSRIIKLAEFEVSHISDRYVCSM